MQARPLVFAVAAGGGGLVEADILAAARIGNEPRLELLDPVAIGVDHRRRDALLGFVIAEHDGGDAGFGLLADQFRHFVIVEIAQTSDHRRAPGHAARLRALLLVDMGDLGRRDRTALQPVLQCAIGVARMLGMQPIGPALADRVELDTLHETPRTDGTGFRGVEEVCLQHLHLQRDGQTVARAPQTPAHQHLARLDHLAADQRLQAIEVELAVSIGRVRPLRKERIDLAVQFVIAAGGARHDARADDVVHQHRHGFGRMRIVAHQIAHPVAQECSGHADFRVGRGARRAPAFGPPPFRSAVIATG